MLLEDAKTIMGTLQNAILLDQIEEIAEASRICPDFEGVRAIHDYRSRVLDTLFGRFQVKADRFRLLLTFFWIGRPRNCDAFRLNLGLVIPSRKRHGSWKPLCHARSR